MLSSQLKKMRIKNLTPFIFIQFSKWQEIMHVVVGESHENPTIRSVEEATGGDDC